MPKELHEMTVDELNALPVYEMFGQTRYKVGEDGKVTLANGRILQGLTPGNWLTVPNRQEIAGAYWVSSDKTPLCWRDADGVVWRPVKLAATGEWRKERG
jgi:hypothetical protein